MLSRMPIVGSGGGESGSTFDIGTPKYAFAEWLNNGATKQVDCGFKAKKIILMGRTSGSNWYDGCCILAIDCETWNAMWKWGLNEAIPWEVSLVHDMISNITDTSFTFKNNTSVSLGFIVFVYGN